MLQLTSNLEFHQQIQHIDVGCHFIIDIDVIEDPHFNHYTKESISEHPNRASWS